MAGENVVFSAKNYGTQNAKLVNIAFGLQVIGDEDQAKDKRAFYPRCQAEDAMSLVLITKTYQQFSDLCDWFRGYGDKTKTGYVEPIRITIASRGFDRTGYYSSGIVYGDAVHNVARVLALQFTGCMDSSVINTWGNGATVSLKGWDPEAIFFYPAPPGTVQDPSTGIVQLSGTNTETSIYGSTTPAPADVLVIPKRGGPS